MLTNVNATVDVDAMAEVIVTAEIAIIIQLILIQNGIKSFLLKLSFLELLQDRSTS